MSSNTPEGPASGGPEFLDSGSGTPVGTSDTTSSGGGRKRALLIGGVVGVLAIGGGAAWAVTSFMATGDQPAQALPANTLAYASIDLDPSGGQKVEAIQMLRKFPEFRDKVGLETDDDLKAKLFETIKDDGCESLDYAADVEPWLGDRAAIAAVDLGQEQPSPVGVIQVTDGGAAEEGLATLQEKCPSEDSSGDEGGWVVDGDWLVLADTDELAQQAVDAEGSLADDEDYQRWTGETGEAGVMSFYVAPSAGEVLGELAASEASDEMGGAVTPEMTAALEDFKGAAGVVRFADAGVEMEFAGSTAAQLSALQASDQGGASIASLPEDTVVAFGLGLEEGWFSAIMDQVSEISGGEMSAEDLYAEAEAQTGLALPEDAETLFGESVAVGLGSGFDPESVFNSADPSDVPVGIKVKGDAEAIDGVLEKIRPLLAGSGMEDMLATSSEGDFVALSPSADYREQLAADGDLGDSDVFTSVVERSDDASAVLFIDFDGTDDWLSTLAADDPKIAENLTPLSALGMSAWKDGDVSHAVVKLTTDD